MTPSPSSSSSSSAPLSVSRPGDHLNPSAVDALIERVIEANGELVIDFPSRIGARPFARFTPYTNNRDVRVHHWTIISIIPKIMPERTILFHPTVIDPYESSDYPLRHFSTEWIRYEAYHARQLDTRPAEDTPFAGDAWRWE